ncbi:MAG: TonB family protein [Phycisphaerae bacterium]|nr:TonB family protein [Phycisphaerae bacterium]
MKLGLVLGVLLAFLFHAGFLLFGGLIFSSLKKDQPTIQQVELLSADDLKEPEKPKELTPEKPEEIKTEEEAPPDASEIIRNLETPDAIGAPALEAVSLTDIEAALRGQTGDGGEFGQAMTTLASGGRIGGTGKAGGMDESLDKAFSLAEIDQKPRVIFQAAAQYPSEMRGKKVEGVVSVAFIVDPSGKVVNLRVEKSTHPAFEKPALDAVKKWKFEAGVRGGQRVPCKMRIPIRFQPS